MTQMKLLSRLLAKNTLNNSKDSSFSILLDQGYLRHDFLLKLRSEYFPFLMFKSQLNQKKLDGFVNMIINLSEEIQSKQANAHQLILKAEFDRKEKIAYDREALKHQKERERQERREKRKKLRIYVAKKEIKGRFHCIRKISYK